MVVQADGVVPVYKYTNYFQIQYEKKDDPAVIILIARSAKCDFSSGVNIIDPNEGIWRSPLGKATLPDHTQWEIITFSDVTPPCWKTAIISLE